MTEAIYKGFCGKMTEAWHELPQARRGELLGTVDSALTASGGRRVIMADSAWCAEQHHFFGIEEFPSLAAVQQFHAALDAISWLRYVDAVTVLGTKWLGEETAAGEIVSFFIGRMTPQWYALGKARQDEIWDRLMAANHEAGGQIVTACDSLAFSSRYSYFGVEVFPNLSAKQQYIAAGLDLDWPAYVDEISLLGTRM